jgi:hypothetical protein
LGLPVRIHSTPSIGWSISLGPQYHEA